MRITVPVTPEMILSADVLLMKGDVIYDNRLLANLRTDFIVTHSKFCSLSCVASFTKEALQSILRLYTSL